MNSKNTYNISSLGRGVFKREGSYLRAYGLDPYTRLHCARCTKHLHIVGPRALCIINTSLAEKLAEADDYHWFTSEYNGRIYFFCADCAPMYNLIGDLLYDIVQD